MHFPSNICSHVCIATPKAAESKSRRDTYRERVNLHSPTLSISLGVSSFLIWRGCDTARRSTGASIHTAWMGEQTCRQSLPTFAEYIRLKQRPPRFHVRRKGCARTSVSKSKVMLEVASQRQTVSSTLYPDVAHGVCYWEHLYTQIGVSNLLFVLTKSHGR